MGKTLNKKMFIRLSTFILIITLLIPLSTHLFDENISEKNQLQEVNLDLDVIIGDPSARLNVYPDVAIRDRDTIHVTGYLTSGGGTNPLSGETIIALWNDSYIDEGITGPDGYYDIPLEPADTMYGDAGKIFGHVNVTAWWQGNEWYPDGGSANETIEVYAIVQMSLSLNPTVLKRNDTFTATTTVAFDNGTYIQGADVYLRLWNGTEYGPQTTDGSGQYSFFITIASGESYGTKLVTGAVDISTVATDTTYINGTLPTGNTNHFWSNDTGTIDVVNLHTITFTLTADPPRIIGDPQGAYRGTSTWIQLQGYFEDENGFGKQWETVWAALLISGTYRRISSTSYYITASDGYFDIGFWFPYSFDGYTVNVGDTNITVLPSITFPDPYVNDKNTLRVYSTTNFAVITTDRSSMLYHRDETITVTSTLYDDQGDPVSSGLSVSAFLFNLSIGYSSPPSGSLTSGSGDFSIYVSASSVPFGNASCSLNVTFDGTVYYDSTFDNSTIVLFFESPDFTNIFLNSISISSYTSLQKSTNYDVEAQLIDDFGRNIVGRSVIVQWNGLPLSTQDTDSEGKVYTSFTTSDYSANPLSLQFSFDYYSGPVYIENYVFSLDNLAPTIDSFSVDPWEVELGESCTISVNVSDDGPVSNVTLVLTDPDGNETRITQQGGSLNFNLQFIIDTSQSRYNILGNWTFYIIVTDREGDSSFSTQGQFEVTEKKGTDIGDITLVVAIIAANVLAAISGYFIARKIRAEGGLGPFFQSLKGKIKK